MKMARSWQNIIVPYFIVLLFYFMGVNTTPVIIPDEPIKPRLPENLCFIEALDEGGKFD